jgi:hypothetical protein
MANCPSNSVFVCSIAPVTSSSEPACATFAELTTPPLVASALFKAIFLYTAPLFASTAVVAAATGPVI